jgi:hypothetical protein
MEKVLCPLTFRLSVVVQLAIFFFWQQQAGKESELAHLGMRDEIKLISSLQTLLNGARTSGSGENHRFSLHFFHLTEPAVGALISVRNCVNRKPCLHHIIRYPTRYFFTRNVWFPAVGIRRFAYIFPLKNGKIEKKSSSRKC